jgi:hypothetical protein
MLSVEAALKERPASRVEGVEKPILVTGSHRSGSTWVGRVLASAPGIAYVEEPFNPSNPIGLWDGAPPPWFCYVHAGNEHKYFPIIRKILGFKQPFSKLWGAREFVPWTHKHKRLDAMRYMVARYAEEAAHRIFHSRPMMKDPIAIFSAGWLADRFGMDVIMLLRHPAAFVLSIKEKKWIFNYQNLVVQPELLRDLLQPYEDQIRFYAPKGEDYDVIEGGSLQWNILYHAARELAKTRPDWQVLRHEDLSREPVDEFRKMFERLRLPFSEQVEREVKERSAEENPVDDKSKKNWEDARRNSKALIQKWKKRLSTEEIDRIRALTEPVSKHYYSDADW